METKIIIDNEIATLYYHPEDKIIHHEFKPSEDGGPLKEVFLAGLELIEREKATKWLSDDRNFPVMDPEYASWARNEWEPKALAAGWAYWAVVMPFHVMVRMNIEDLIVQTAEKGLTVRAFEDLTEAYAWLKSC